jgi:hypothetical protein
MAMLAAAIKTMAMIVSICVELNAEKFMTISPVLTRILDPKVNSDPLTGEPSYYGRRSQLTVHIETLSNLILDVLRRRHTKRQVTPLSGQKRDGVVRSCSCSSDLFC